MEKLSLESGSPPKPEIRRDVVDSPAPLVSETGREGPGPKRKGSRQRSFRQGKDGNLHTIVLLLCSVPTCSLWLGNSAAVIGHGGETEDRGLTEVKKGTRRTKSQRNAELESQGDSFNET